MMLCLTRSYQLCFQLQFYDRKGVPHDFIHHFQIYPTVIVHLILQPLLESLEMLLKVSSEPVIVHYDTVFKMGDFFLLLFFGTPYLFAFLSILDDSKKIMLCL